MELAHHGQPAGCEESHHSAGPPGGFSALHRVAKVGDGRGDQQVCEHDRPRPRLLAPLHADRY
eukprot:15782650-Heterocapsa_arctica.AAC.1